MLDTEEKIAADEVGLNAGAQDDRDMERLGKVQEFKVRAVSLVNLKATRN